MMIVAITLAALSACALPSTLPARFFPWPSATPKKWPHLQARPLEYLLHNHSASEGKSGPCIRLRFARARLRQDH
jgi:hypothetical protein